MRRDDDDEGGHGGGHERWLLTYADMITLLMIFFIILYVMSTVNQAKFQALANSLNIALEGGTGLFESAGPSMIDGQTAGVASVSESQLLSEVQKELTNYLEQEGLAKTVSVHGEARGLVISFQEMILFHKGNSTLTSEAQEIVAKVGGMLKSLPNYIRVEGHTCNLPISNGTFHSNWELSSARAITVVNEFIASSGLEPERLSATGYGEYRPRATNDSEDNRILNRRVDIVVLSSKFEDIEPGSQNTTGLKKPENLVDAAGTQQASAAEREPEQEEDKTYVP